MQLDVPEHYVRVIAPEVGGGFGSKCNVWAEEALCAHVAMELKRPIKWIESRRESIQVVAHGRAHVDTLELAAKSDGTLTGLKLHIVCDIGAHHQLLTPIIPTLAVLMLPGLYKFRSFNAELIGAFTNRAPSDLYRGAGRPEATYVIERMVDKVAAKLGMDPAEIRFKNFPASTDFPFDTATGLQYDSGDYAAAFNKALDMVDYKARRADQEAARSEGRLYGIGISNVTAAVCATFGPSPATPGRRLGKPCDGQCRHDRQGCGDDGYLAARPGRGDVVRTVDGGCTGNPDGRHRDYARRYSQSVVRHRHLWQPGYLDRRLGASPGAARHHREGDEVRGSHHGGRRGGSEVRGWRVLVTGRGGDSDPG